MNLFKPLFSHFLLRLFILFLLTVSPVQADPPLEVRLNGKVRVTTELETPILDTQKLNISSILHLEPLSSPPANPSPGDIYFTTTNELLLFAAGKWTPIVSAEASHGTVHFTSPGSGTWEVPAGVYYVKATLAGGGGGGSAATYTGNVQGHDGKPGGNGGVRLNAFLDVVPGQKISYTIGTGGAGAINYYNNAASGGATTFGSISASGGQGRNSDGSGGANGYPAGSYPYSSYGQSGAGGLTCSGMVCFLSGSPGTSGAIYIEY